ncbi:MAG: ExbD/TolR family protein [Waterburya sp.]
MRLPDEPEIPFQINIVPMIDVIFAILTFFIMSSLSLNRSAGISVNLPSAKTAESKQNTPIYITVEKDGDVFLEKKQVNIDQLSNSLKESIKDQSKSLVVINADKQVNHGQVVKVMDRVRQIPGATMAIAAEQE